MGSLVVNSSQGGGSKDAWVLTPTGEAHDGWWPRPAGNSTASRNASRCGLPNQARPEPTLARSSSSSNNNNNSK